MHVAARTVIPLVTALLGVVPCQADEPRAAAEQLFARKNLVAWFIVPFDAARRNPEQRAELLQELGFTKFAYDWRAEHLPTFEAELEALQRRRIELTAVWFPGAMNDDARQILATLKRRGVRTQLWVTITEPPAAADGNERPAGEAVTSDSLMLARTVEALRPIVEAAEAQGCQVGLYNHGGWFGEPENQLAVIDALAASNVGIVYNLHHGHAHVDRLPEVLAKLSPHLLAVNLNGMDRDGERLGRKILPLGQGDLDVEVLRAIVESGYGGPFGVLGHTDDDARARLLDNLDGLDWLVAQLDGRAAGDRPTPRTPVPPRP